MPQRFKTMAQDCPSSVMRKATVPAEGPLRSVTITDHQPE